MPDRPSSSAFPWLWGLLFAAGAALLLYGGLVHAPTEKTMGDAQRIFYFHVPSAMNAALAYLLAAVAGGGFLIRRTLAWDQIGRAAVETGTLWATVVIVTGPIWARSAWGTWWTWEPRLTTSLIAWLIFIGAAVVRKVAHNPEQAARLAAVIQIVGFLDLPVVYKSVDWWRGNHPMIFRGGQNPLAPEMWTGFLAGMCGVTLMHAALFAIVWRYGRLSDRLAAAERHSDEEGDRR